MNARKSKYLKILNNKNNKRKNIGNSKMGGKGNRVEKA